MLQGHHPAAFPFFYISPSTPELNLKLTRKYTGDISQQEAEKIAPIGNAPTMLTFADLKKVLALLARCSATTACPSAGCGADGRNDANLCVCAGGSNMDEPQPGNLP